MESDWNTVTLSDISERIGDGLHGTPKYSENGEYYFVNGNNLESGCIVYKEATKRVDFNEYQKHKKELTDSTILVSINGTIGNVALYNGEEVVLGKSACYINLKKGISKEFVKYILSGYLFQEYIQRCSTGSTIKNVSLKMMRDFSFKIPEDEAEQNRAVGILKDLDNKIELNRQINQTLEQMAQTLFKSWFVDFDPVFDNLLAKANYQLDNLPADFPEELHPKAVKRLAALSARIPSQEHENKGLVSANESDNVALPHPDFPSEFEFNEQLGWVPLGWEVKSVSEAIKVNPRTTLSKGSIATFADMKAIPTSGYMVDEVIEKEYKGGAKFKKNDVLFARITPCLQNGKTALVDFLSDNEVGFGSTEFIVFREGHKINYPYIACLAREENFRAHCMQSMVGSSGRQRVQNACFDDYYLAVPNESSVLNKFKVLASVNFTKMTNNKLENQSLTKLRDTLLPKLISGELQIPDLDSRSHALRGNA